MSSIFNKHIIFTFVFFIFLLLFVAECVEKRSIVRTLPGYSGLLPFKLETGYVSVNESELFYLFVESQGKPREDPLLVYLIGGPGCSALNAFFFQVGPLMFNTTDYPGGLPQLIENPYSWTTSSSIIFLDSPVGTGFSYATSPDGYYVTDLSAASQVHIFMRKWLKDHPEFLTTQFFIACDSYSGVVAPIIAQDIIDGNQAGLHPPINLKGLIGGSPHTDSVLESNSDIVMYYHLGLIPKSLYESAKNSCQENYVDVDPSNTQCLEDLLEIDECIEMINTEDILDPKCATIQPKSSDEQVQRRYDLQLNSQRYFNHLPSSTARDYWCRNFEYILVDVWANDERVQDALHVRKGRIKEWFRCNISVSHVTYRVDVSSAVAYYQNFSANTGLQILLYSGDHDLVVPYISTEEWISTLNVTIDTAWRPWFVEGQVAGYTVKYENYGFRLTFATLKGSGHSPTQYKPEQCYNMFLRWIHYYPL